MHVEASVTIDKPVDEVFRFATALENAAKWQEGVEESTQTSSGPMQKGATTRHRSRFMGRPVDVVGEVTDYDPPRLFAYRVSGTFSYTGRQTFVPVETRTRATYAFEAQLPWALRLLGPLTATLARRRIERDYRRLKSLLESGVV